MTTGTPPAVQVGVGDLTFDVQVDGPDSPPSAQTAALLLHGFPQSAASWRAVGRRLSASGISSYAPNQRGYSPGARPTKVGDYRLPALISDVIGLCDALELDTVHLVGHDWGAIVAWAVAATHPARVSSLTAVSVPHPAAFDHAIRFHPEQREKSAYMAMLEAEGTAELLLAQDGAALRLGFGAAVAQPIAETHIRLLSQPGAMTAALNWYRAKGTDWEGVPAVRVPTTFVWGTDDLAVTSAAADRCAEYVEGPYEFVALPGISHWVPEEVPSRLSAAIVHRIVDGQ
ncbi:alpha/beta fold hydrolase [Nocardia goodfellowii]